MVKLQAHVLAQFWGLNVGIGCGMCFEAFPCILNLLGRANGVNMHRNTFTYLMIVDS